MPVEGQRVGKTLKPLGEIKRGGNQLI